ncbi:hypothetical protein JNUCC1_02146 [Lentibacillus sp. JNUCC-1]|nr:hypothetical protein [Lentibacillus sp. JNUCC-1]
MSSNKVTMGQVVWKQYRYKLKAYHQVFTSLVVLQLMALLFSSGPVSSSGGGGYGMYVSLNSYTGDVILIFTFLWVTINAITMMTRAYREDDFLFVTNHTSQHIANILFLITASVIGAVTATLVNYLYRILTFYLTEKDNFIGMIDDVSPVLDPLIGILGATFYLLMFGALGYLIGSMVQLHRVFIFLLPVLFVGALFFDEWTIDTSVIGEIFIFYAGETNLLLFILKTAITAVVLFTGAFFLLGKKEVRA